MKRVVHEPCRISHLLQSFVEFAVLESVCLFLTDEAGNLLLSAGLVT